MNDAPTHAGVVALRTDGDEARYLIISSSDGRHLVLPKGHIEAGETPEQAAARELREEAGVTGQLLAPLTTQRVEKPEEVALIRYFLVRATSHGQGDEGRSLHWLPYPEARTQLSFEDARQVLDRAKSSWERAQP